MTQSYFLRDQGYVRTYCKLSHFLNSILDEQITLIKLSDPHLKATQKNDEDSVMDIRVETENGEQINIEIQLRNHQAFEERMLMYWTKMYGSQHEKGQNYTKLRQAVQIIITDFEMYSTERFHRKFGLMDIVDHTVFTDHIAVHVLQLPKVIKKEIKNTSELEKWLLFLKCDGKTKEELAMESSTMKDAYEEIQRLSQDKETRRLADYREHELRGQMQREADAIEQREREIVLNMFKQKVSLEDIAKLTGIHLKKVNEIVESVDNP